MHSTAFGKKRKLYKFQQEHWLSVISHMANPHGPVRVHVDGPLYQLSPGKSHRVTSELFRNVGTIKLERLKTETELIILNWWACKSV